MRQAIDVSIAAVEVFEAVAYAAVQTGVHAYDLLTGELLHSVSFGQGAVRALAREGEMLYSLDDEGTLRAIELDGPFMTPRGEVQTVSTGGSALFVGGARAYVPRDNPANPTAGGFAIYDVSDPLDLTELSGIDDNVIAGNAIDLNASGLAILVDDRISVGDRFEAVVDVVDVSDPTRTDAFVTRFIVPSVHSVAFAEGLAFVGGDDALHVLNYVPFDDRGQPPTVTLDAAALDLDPASPGIQALEGSRITLDAQISDDVQVARVEVLLDNRVVRSNVAFPFDLSVTLPLLAEGHDAVELRVRAIDTGGNATTSEPITLELVPDTVAPQITRTSPDEDALVGRRFRVATLAFSKALDPATVSLDRFHFIAPDGSTVAAETMHVPSLARQVRLVLSDEEKAAGQWQLVIDGPAVTDRVGNALGDEPIVLSFNVAEAVTVAWINPDGGFWDEPTNWDAGRLPGPLDDVVIDIDAR